MYFKNVKFTGAKKSKDIELFIGLPCKIILDLKVLNRTDSDLKEFADSTIHPILCEWSRKNRNFIDHLPR